MGNFKNTKYGPASVSNAGAGGAGGGPVAGDDLVLLQGPAIDISGAVLDTIDPCAAVWPNAVKVSNLIKEYPADATIFNVTTPSYAGVGVSLTDYISVGAVFACDEAGIISPVTVEVADGASATEKVETYIAVSDLDGNCACP